MLVSDTRACGAASDKIPDSVPGISTFHPVFESSSPAGLEKYAVELDHVLQCYAKNTSNTPCPPILLLGPFGSGRHTLAQSLCWSERTRRFVRINMPVECAGDTAASTCAKIKQKLLRYSGPNDKNESILLYLESIDCFFTSGDNARAVNERRVVDQLLQSIRDACLQGSPANPVIVIASFSMADHSLPTLDADLSATFTHKIQILPLTVAERRKLVLALAKFYNLKLHAYSGELPVIISMTDGFYLADFLALMKKARVHAKLNEISTLSERDWIQVLRSLESSSPLSSKIPDITWADVGGLDSVKQEIMDAVRLPLLYPQLFNSTSLRRSGLVLHGPPGNGKTLAAKAAANECNVRFLSIKGPELVSMYVGQSEENVRNIFTHARQIAPCIIFFDELDAIAPNRGRAGDSGGVIDRVVSQLLAEMDGLSTTDSICDEEEEISSANKQIFIIGATNRPELIDPALLRPGRFEKQIYVGSPSNREEQRKILLAQTRRLDLCCDGVGSREDFIDVILDELLCDRPHGGLTGADIQALCANACVAAIKRIGRAQKESDQQQAAVNFVLTMGDFRQAAARL